MLGLGLLAAGHVDLCVLPSADSSTGGDWDPSEGAGPVKYAHGGWCRRPCADCACQCDCDGGRITLFYDSRCPSAGDWLRSSATHARYGNEGWGLIIISSLPVRCAAAFTHGSTAAPTWFKPELNSCEGLMRSGAGWGWTLWPKAASPC